MLAVHVPQVAFVKPRAVLWQVVDDVVLERGKRVRVRAHVLLGQADPHLVDARKGVGDLLELRAKKLEALLGLLRLGVGNLLSSRQQVLLLDVRSGKRARVFEQPVQEGGSGTVEPENEDRPVNRLVGNLWVHV